MGIMMIIIIPIIITQVSIKAVIVSSHIFFYIPFLIYENYILYIFHLYFQYIYYLFYL